MLELYKNIKRRREELGMSQAELAKKVGYTSRSTIARIERGDIDLSQTKIVEIAKALYIPAGELMGLDGIDFAPAPPSEGMEECIHALITREDIRTLVEVALQADMQDVIQITELLRRLKK